MTTEREAIERVDAELEAILAKSDDEIMNEELFQLFGRYEGPFSREEMLKAMSINFELGKQHILMVNEAAKSTALSALSHTEAGTRSSPFGEYRG
jgi:hypothetical protein